LQGGFKTLIIKAPTLWKDWLFEDFARITGATVVDPAAGTSLKQFAMSWLGTCDKLITTKDETRVIGIKDISEYVEQLSQGSDEDKLRASWLQTKVATLKLGANSESELSYVRLKAEDARNAAYLALQDGIVPGGGVALMQAADALPDTVGGRILHKALYAPITQIITNAGVDHEKVMLLYGEGFDARTKEVVNMWDAGIVDPVRVVKNSVKNAISVAGTVLTTQVVINLPKAGQNEAPRQMPGM
jgi:chaperonin GroEL